MSNAATLTAPGAAAPAVKKKAFRVFTIRFKFALFTVLLIATVMSAVGYSLYVQQRAALTREVLGRGRTIAENLAAASREAMLSAEPLLNLSVLAKNAVQAHAPDIATQEGHDLKNTQHLVVGLGHAVDALKVEVPQVIEQGLSRLAGRPLRLGFDSSDARQGKGLENQGVFEAIIVGKDGLVASDYRGTTGYVGLPYKAPKTVQEASAEVPFPIYEQEVFQNNQRYTRRLFHLEQPITAVSPETGQPVSLGTVHLGVDEDLVNGVVFNVTMKLAAIGLFAGLLGIVFTYLVVTYLTGPIGKLVRGVLNIAGGDFDTRVKVSSKDELGELTNAFNTMAVSLGQNEMLRGAFTRYVSDAALKQILSDPGKTGLHSKRTLATIYSSDVRGFTSMSETLEPEQVVQVINTYLSLQTEIILQHGGVVDKFIGDATIGVWGKETPGPDDAINAVRAAWDSQAAITKMNEERAARGEIVKEIGIGVNTGEVVSGNMGSSKKMEYTVTGEHVIFADRICDHCLGGKVLISESTYAVVKDQVEVEMTHMKAKGHDGEGTVVYLVTGFK